MRIGPCRVSLPTGRLSAMDSLTGQFLIASPSILDPNFRRAVVFVTPHSDEGAVGVIPTRRSDATVGEAVPQLAPVTDLDDAVFVGGPVNPEGVAVLAEFHDPDEAGVVVIEDIGFVALDDALEEGAPELERTRVFAGVAGWGPEQLEDELERDEWIVESADLDDIFTEDPDGLWSAILRRKGGQYEQVAREAGLQLRQRLQRCVRFRPGDDDAHEVAEGRVAELPPPLELARQEAWDVVTRCELDRPRVRLERLDEHAPGCVAPAAAGELCEQLERALLGAEVRQAEARVGVDHRRQRHAREVMPFRHHLCADEHDTVGGREARERSGERARPLDRVRIETDPFQFGHFRLELALEPLRPGAEPSELGEPHVRHV